MSALLALTDTAVEAVKHIVSSSEEISETGGLRLVAEQTGMQTNLELSVVPLPAEDDDVPEEQGRPSLGGVPRRVRVTSAALASASDSSELALLALVLLSFAVVAPAPHRPRAATHRFRP